MKRKPLTEYWPSLDETFPPPDDVPGSLSSVAHLDVYHDSDVVPIESDCEENSKNAELGFLTKTFCSSQIIDLENTPPKKNRSSLIRSHSTSPSSSHSEVLFKIVRSPSFLTNYNKIQERGAEDLKGARVSRKKEKRKLLHGYDCKCCATYYEALGLNSPERQTRIDQVSRHRHVEAVPTTPDNYWEVKMADREEQIRRGQIAETSSPVGLRPRNPLYATKSFCRRLFQS